MKDFAGSSITYYGLARKKVMSKYPRLISVLMILALISMTGLAIFLISDLVSFASNPDHKGVLFGLDLKGPENGILSGTDDKEKSRNISENSSNLSQIKATLPSSQSAKIVVSASKSSSSSSNTKEHHSSSSSSSVKPAKKSNDKNNLTQEGNASNKNNFQWSNDPEIETTAIPASLTSAALGAVTNPTGDIAPREPATIIQFKTDTPSVLDSSNNAPGTSSQVSKVTAPSRSEKAQEFRAKQIANRNLIAENMKKKTAQSRARAASK